MCVAGSGVVGKYRHRTFGRDVDPEQALAENWIYTPKGMCLLKDEGVTWARGWRTKAADAFRTSVALGLTGRSDRFEMRTYAIGIEVSSEALRGPTEPPAAQRDTLA